MVCISDCTGAVVKYAYNSIGQRVLEHRKINDNTEQVFIYHYDAAGRLAELKQSADEEGCGHKTSSIRYEYDHNGNMTRIRLPYGAEICREYDAKDRLTLETHSEKSSNIQNTIRFCYDKADNLTRITDNLGRETEFSYDLMNQEIKRRERDGGITRTVYDRNGNLVKIIRPNQYAQYGEKGSGIQYIYDSLDQITTVINADGRIQETYAYDKAGNLREKLDGNGNRVSYTYDLSGHYTYIRTSGNATQQYEYDPYGNITGIVDGEGNHTQYVNHTVYGLHTVYGFDKWGRIVEIKRADGESEFYRYDYAGNITKSVDANGNATLYEYNCIGKMAKMTDPLGYSEHYYYDVGNRLCHMVDRNGTETTYGYNLYNSLTEETA